MTGETKAVLLKSVSASESLNISGDAGTFLPDSVQLVCVFSEILLSLLMVLFLSIFDEDGTIFSAKKFYQKEIEETRGRRAACTFGRLFVLHSLVIAFVVIGIGISGRIVRSLVVVAEFFTWSKAVVSGEVVEK